MVMEMEISTTL